MALSKRTVDVQLEIYVNSDGTFSRAVGTRRVEVIEDGAAVIAERNSQIPMTLAQVKSQVAALT
jgi:hypothetical protein